MPASIPNDIYQYSTHTAFASGLTSDGPPTAFLTSHGTHGIGYYDPTTAMVQIDSVAYALHPDGEATVAEQDARLPFVMVCVFEPRYRATIPHALEMSGLRAVFARGGEVAGGKNTPMPFRIKGKFAKVEVIGGKVLEGVSGTIFGFGVPEWQEGISGVGIQACFLAEGGKIGGRVQGFAVDGGADVDWAKCGRFHLGFPQSEEWEMMELGGSQGQE